MWVSSPDCSGVYEVEKGVDWRSRLISSRPKSLTELKTNPEPSPFGLVCCSLSQLCFLPTMISTSELVVLRAPTWHLGNAWPRAPWLCDTPRDAAEPVEGSSATDEVEGIQGTASPFPWPKTQVSPCRRIHFTCFLICWSNRVRSVGKAEITFKFPDSLRRLLSVYDVVTASRLMCLFYSHSSECTEQGYTTATATQVYTRCYLVVNLQIK